MGTLAPAIDVSELQQRITNAKQSGDALISALQNSIDKFGLENAPQVPDFSSAKCTLERDPYSQQETLVCSFFGNSKHRVGQMLFHGDGKNFAEFDVARVHPKQPGLFIEAVEAWQHGERIRTDIRLLEMP